MSTLGEKIKDLRIKKGLTQPEMGKILNIGKSTISQYENNKNTPDAEMLKRIADLFNVSIDYLLGRDNAIENSKNDTYTAPLTPKDERDIEKAIAKLKEDWSSQPGLMLSGQAVSEEALEAIFESLASGIKYAKMINKKYTPKKYRKNETETEN